MPQIEIRPSVVADLDQLLMLERNYVTQYVFQIDIEEDEEDEVRTIRLRRVRLPRAMRVEYPRNRQQLLDEWANSEGLLVASQEGRIVGYVAFSLQKAPSSIWITDLVVSRPLRRQGIARALVLAVEEWASEREQQRLILEMQSRNDPAIQMAKRFGFDFCGFQEAYYPNGDVALFFARNLR